MRVQRVLYALALLALVGATLAVPSIGSDASRLGTRLCTPAWRVVPSPGVEEGTLESVAALSESAAWAVGGVVRRGGLTGGEIVSATPLIERWDGKSWAVVPSPKVLGLLTDVAVRSSRDAWAVGYQGRVASSGTPLVLRWNGKVWSRVTLPPEIRGTAAVSATGANDVWVAGTTGGSAEVSHWDGQRWTRVFIRRATELIDITTVSRRDVWAVGSTWSSHDWSRALMMHWNGKRWQSFTRKAQPGYDDGWLIAVGGTAGDDLWAGGAQHMEEMSPPAIAPLMLHWDGRSWKYAKLPSSGETAFSGIAAITRDEAWAVSDNPWSYELQGDFGYATWRMTANRWRATELPFGSELMDAAAVPRRRSSTPTIWSVGQTGTGITDFAAHTKPLIRRFGC